MDYRVVTGILAILTLAAFALTIYFARRPAGNGRKAMFACAWAGVAGALASSAVQLFH